MSSIATDVALVRAAQAGDPASMGLLLERHRAGMYAVALSLLGYGAEAEDAVQDAMLVSLQQLGQLRTADAVGPWLRTIVRNTCRMRLRGPRAVPTVDVGSLPLLSAEPSPEEMLDRHVLRDWVWHAIEGLSEPLRLAVMLRYFGGVSSYEQIAGLCGVPVGTVRSRLNQAKLKLADALLATASGAHPDAGARTADRRREVAEFFALAERGDGEHAANAMFWPDVEIITPWGEAFHGQEALVRGHAVDCEAGVRLRLTDVIAGRDLTVVKGVFLNPADDPTHCPPGVMMVHFLREGRIQRMRYFHPRASTGVDDDRI